MLTKIIATLVPMLIATGTSGTSASVDRSDQWGALADQAITQFQANDTGSETPHAYAYIMGAIARRHGWTDPRISIYLSKLYSLRNPDGGWGLNYAWDAFSNGTVNPANTTYTITLADHVGPVLLDAYAAGIVPTADIMTIINLLMTTNTAQYSSGKYGRCVAYSRSSNDTVVAVGCVHNVSASAAYFLWKAHQAGFDAPGMLTRVGQLVKKAVVEWDATTKWWPYLGSGAPADTDHTAAQAEFIWDLARSLAYETAKRILTEGLVDNDMAPVAHMRLTGLDSSWCSLGDIWIPEAQTFVNSPPTNRARAQAAYWASRNAAVC